MSALPSPPVPLPSSSAPEPVAVPVRGPAAAASLREAVLALAGRHPAGSPSALVRAAHAVIGGPDVSVRAVADIVYALVREGELSATGAPTRGPDRLAAPAPAPREPRRSGPALMRPRVIPPANVRPGRAPSGPVRMVPPPVTSVGPSPVAAAAGTADSSADPVLTGDHSAEPTVAGSVGPRPARAERGAWPDAVRNAVETLWAQRDAVASATQTRATPLSTAEVRRHLLVHLGEDTLLRTSGSRLPATLARLASGDVPILQKVVVAGVRSVFWAPAAAESRTLDTAGLLATDAERVLVAVARAVAQHGGPATRAQVAAVIAADPSLALERATPLAKVLADAARTQHAARGRHYVRAGAGVVRATVAGESRYAVSTAADPTLPFR